MGIGGQEVEGAADDIRGGMVAGDWNKELRSAARVEVEVEEGATAMVTCSFFDNRLYRDISQVFGGVEGRRRVLGWSQGGAFASRQQWPTTRGRVELHRDGVSLSQQPVTQVLPSMVVLVLL